MTSRDQRFVRRWSKTRQIPIWWYVLRFGLLLAIGLTALTFLLDYAIDQYIEPINIAQFFSRVAVRIVIFSIGGIWNWFMNERRYRQLTEGSNS